jgi:hypothetical protein
MAVILKMVPDSPFISFFGLNFYFDDLLLICVILFLFTEGIDNYFLLFILVLLLLS